MEAPDLSELQRSKVYKFRAYCTSTQCCKKKEKVEKKVTRDKVECPDCGYSLFWQKETHFI
jgi:hypothetical protein